MCVCVCVCVCVCGVVWYVCDVVYVWCVCICGLCVCVLLYRVQLCATPYTVACQAPLSMEFSR